MCGVLSVLCSAVVCGEGGHPGRLSCWYRTLPAILEHRAQPVVQPSPIPLITTRTAQPLEGLWCLWGWLIMELRFAQVPGCMWLSVKLPATSSRESGTCSWHTVLGFL